MDDVSPAPAATPERVGETLRVARERLGLSLAEIASRTRVPLRHLQAIETSDYAALPSQTYATGFTKAFARVVGVDEVAITRRLRGELAHVPRAPEYQPYEAPDPARVPSRGLAIVALGVALAVIVLAGLWFAGVLNGGGGNSAPVAAPADTIAAAPAAPAAVPNAPAPTPTPAAAPAATGGQVSLSTIGRVWLRVHDGDRTLYLGTMAPGEHFDVPADAKDPLVDVGRPDKLAVTLNGAALPTLPPSDHPMKDLRVGAAAVAARLNGATAPIATPTPPVAQRSRHAPASRGARPRPAARPLDETARANLAAQHATTRKTP